MEGSEKSGYFREAQRGGCEDNKGELHQIKTILMTEPAQVAAGPASTDTHPPKQEHSERVKGQGREEKREGPQMEGTSNITEGKPLHLTRQGSLFLHTKNQQQATPSQIRSVVGASQKGVRRPIETKKLCFFSLRIKAADGGRRRKAV